MKRMLIFILLTLSLALSGCGFQTVDGNTIRGSGKIASETRAVSGFTRIAVQTAGRITVTKGEADSLVIEAEDNILPLLVSEVQGDQLVLHTRPNTSYNATRQINYTITVKDLRAIDVSSSADVEAGDFQASAFNLALGGSGNVTLASLQAGSLGVEISGSGSAEVRGGSASGVNANLHSSGNFKAASLQSQTAQVSVSGSGTATVWVKTNLSATLSGSGNLEYYGSPTVSQNVSGSGRVQSRGNK